MPHRRPHPLARRRSLPHPHQPIAHQLAPYPQPSPRPTRTLHHRQRIRRPTHPLPPNPIQNRIAKTDHPLHHPLRNPPHSNPRTHRCRHSPPATSLPRPQPPHRNLTSRPHLGHPRPNLPPSTETNFWVPRTAFFQINRYLLPELRSPSHIANRTGQLAWDLYAGVGLFSKALAATFTQVTAVEIAEPAFAALAASKLPNLHAIKATTLDFLRAAVIQRERPGLIILDPPRSGAGPEICALLARVAAPTLIYVSCSPQHLAADLIPLTASGYTISQLHLLDLFPQTTHLETIAILTRTEPI